MPDFYIAKSSEAFAGSIAGESAGQTLVFLDDPEQLVIVCMILDASGKRVRLEQFSRPKCKSDYKICKAWLRDYRRLDPDIGEHIFKDAASGGMRKEAIYDWYSQVKKNRPPARRRYV